MTRKIFDSSRIHTAIQGKIGGAPEHQQTVADIETELPRHDIVVVGMKQNPFPKKARELLDAQGQRYHYMEYGSYFSEWKRRSTIKMWTGWQTFPMIFVKGQFIGGFDDLKALVNSGELKKLLS